MRKFALVALGLVVASLVALGLIVLFSASAVNAERIKGDAYYFIVRQGMFLFAGLAAAFIVSKIDYHFWRDYWQFSAFGYVLVLGLLLLVFAYRPINGSHRWLPIGPVSLQPSEFAKITLVIVLSVWLDKIAYKVKTFNKGALFSALLMLGFIGPVIAEPDFGSTVVLGIVGGSLMLVAGVKLIHIGLFFVVGLAGFLGMVLTNKNRLARLIDFFGVEGGTLSPAAKRAAYQVGESMDAIMAGGFWGKGYGESLHKHSYLPEAHTDFVLAVGAEELGLWFIIVVLLLFSLFFVISIYIARKAADKFGKFIVYGMMVIIYFQAMFNVGVVCKALPTKGMALPFFSYGGTNLMTSLIAVGMIFSVGLYSYREGRRKLTNIKIHGG